MWAGREREGGMEGERDMEIRGGEERAVEMNRAGSWKSGLDRVLRYLEARG